uniref:Uncharacterized protein n=1 Tax=Mustela putorius furo TaxID=9669 RepID=M3YA51_MUSPF
MAQQARSTSVWRLRPPPGLRTVRTRADPEPISTFRTSQEEVTRLCETGQGLEQEPRDTQRSLEQRPAQLRKQQHCFLCQPRPFRDKECLDCERILHRDDDGRRGTFFLVSNTHINRPLFPF